MVLISYTLLYKYQNYAQIMCVTYSSCNMQKRPKPLHMCAEIPNDTVSISWSIINEIHIAYTDFHVDQPTTVSAHPQGHQCGYLG